MEGQEENSLCAEVRRLSLQKAALNQLPSSAQGEGTLSSAADRLVELRVRDDGEDNFLVHVDLWVDTVATLKHTIQTIIGVQPLHQQLFVEGIELVDTEAACLGKAYPRLQSPTSILLIVYIGNVGIQRLPWYDQLLPFVVACENCMVDWKAWANRGALLYKLGEKQASWDAYKQGALALRSFQVDLSDEDLLSDVQLGKFFKQLDKEFRLDGWSSCEAHDITFFAVLAQRGRASEVCTMRWHEILPNHYFSVMTSLCRKLSAGSIKLQNVIVDDFGEEEQRANCLPLLVSEAGLFVDRGNNKRARLQDCVRDVCVRVSAVRGKFAALDFEVEIL